MANVFQKIIFVLWSLPTYSSSIIQEEYCVDESFNPQCSNKEIVLMHSALYGRMNLGKCLPTDHGFMGCQANVMTLFDGKCSGKPTCDIFVTDKTINPQGGCMKGLQSYLEVEYECVKGIDTTNFCKSNQDNTIEPSETDFYISEMQLRGCTSQNHGVLLKTKEGQVMHISQINLQHTISTNTIYGTIKDIAANKRVLIGEGPRNKQLLVSTSHELELTLTAKEESSNRFMLHITVSGCPNMPPPEGAWMTRDDDVMEIGCHSGAKVWSLKCEENQWVGAVGQCGTDIDSNAEDDLQKTTKKQTESLSINAMLFGVSSLVIFTSAVIFLAGVCLLKKKLRPLHFDTPTTQKTILLDQYQDEAGNIFPTLPGPIPMDQSMYGQSQNYKSLRLAQKETGKDPSGVGINTTGIAGFDAAPPAYMNSAARSDASDSVKYYVLEDATKYK